METNKYKKRKNNSMDAKLEQIIELFFLGFLIILRLMDFTGILPGDLDYLMKVISWVAMGYLFVKVSLSSILFGHRKIRFDVAVVLTYFLFTVKDLIGNVEVEINEAFLLKDFYAFLLYHNLIIEKYSFYLGGILLLFISLYSAIKFGIKEPSFMAVLHEIGPPPQTKR